jgi:hypothetical protein
MPGGDFGLQPFQLFLRQRNVHGRKYTKLSANSEVANLAQ